jgi:thiosulfate/3-mercaptopyruvate sulfurtransferase
MPLALPTPLVSTDWLARHLDHPDLVVLDASWYLPAMGRDGRAEYLAGHVPGALFWDLDALSERHSPLPHMLPDPATFAAQVGQLGVETGNAVVVYDGSGANLSAARVWWMFRVFGHDQVSVLDGGLGRWRAEGRPLEAGARARGSRRFAVQFRPELVRSRAEVERLLGSDRVQLVDARSAGRFAGEEPEPRPGLRGGHIPGARNLPYQSLVADDGTLLAPEHLERRFREAGVDLDRPVVLTCGSGVSACAIALALERMGRREHAVYDGAWAEWGAAADLPVATGPAGPLSARGSPGTARRAGEARDGEA